MPPPPVCGAVVGYGRADGIAVCVLAECVAAVCVVFGVASWVADEVCDPDDACDADARSEVDARLETEAAAARADVLVPLADAAPDLAEDVPECPCPVGDGVRVP